MRPSHTHRHPDDRAALAARLLAEWDTGLTAQEIAARWGGMTEDMVMQLLVEAQEAEDEEEPPMRGPWGILRFHWPWGMSA